MGENLFRTTLAVVPKLRTPIQLAGLVFSSLSATLIYRVDPNNTIALAVVGAVAVALLATPLTFQAAFLRVLRPQDRAYFLLALLVIVLIAFGVLATLTVQTIQRASPAGVRFDSKLEPHNITYHRKSDGSYRIQMAFQLFPLSKEEDLGATVFTGIVVVHDEHKIQSDGFGQKSDLPCDKVASCLGSVTLTGLSASPLLVRSNSPGTPMVILLDVKSAPELARVWWEFYQREGIAGATCGFDINRPAPLGGIPHLAMFRGGRPEMSECYRSYGQLTHVPHIHPSTLSKEAR